MFMKFQGKVQGLREVRVFDLCAEFGIEKNLFSQIGFSFKVLLGIEL